MVAPSLVNSTKPWRLESSRVAIGLKSFDLICREFVKYPRGIKKVSTLEKDVVYCREMYTNSALHEN
jgi:hypothetical protein